MPLLGHNNFSLSLWENNFINQNIIPAILRSFLTGFIATLISFFIAVSIASTWMHYRFTHHKKKHNAWKHNFINIIISFILAIPHQVFAIAMLLLLMPSGMIMRFFAMIFDWQSPHDAFVVLPDDLGIFYIFILTIKETCFLLLFMHIIVTRHQLQQYYISAISLGYHPITSYLLFIFPQIYKQLRLVIFIVLIYSISNVDIAYFTTVTTKPNIALTILELWHDPNLDKKRDAAVMVVVLLMISIIAIASWILCEKIFRYYFYHIIQKQYKYYGSLIIKNINIILLLTLFLLIIAIITLILWSFAGYWRFPDIHPQSLNIDHWMNHYDDLLQATGNSILIAVTSSIISLIIFIIHYYVFVQNHQQQHYHHNNSYHTPYWILISLIIPQSCLFFGIVPIIEFFNLGQSRYAIISLQLFSVIPYIFLSLYTIFTTFSPSVMITAMSLGLSPFQLLIKIIIPILTPAILIGFAIGCAVSIADYLSVFLGGGGHYHSLSSLTISIMNSADLSGVSATGLLLSLLPAIIFIVCLYAPKVIFRHHKYL